VNRNVPPFTICPLLAWADVPAQLRGKYPPEERADPSDSRFTVDCALDNSVVTVDSNIKVHSIDLFTVHVLWGPDVTPHPADAQVTIGDRRASIERGTARGHVYCAVIFPISRGVLAAEVNNNRFPDIDTCAVAEGVARGALTRMP
jgi:hypothetical protein